MNRWLLVSWTLTGLAFLAQGYLYLFRHELIALDPVPVHWNIHGQPDHYVPRDDLFWYIMLSPLSMLVMTLLTYVLPWLSPKHFEVDLNRQLYYYVMFLVVLMMGALGGVISLVYLRPEMNFLRWLLGVFSVFFILLGNVLGKMPRNFWIGVRTPWTLANQTVWTKTHRLSAWMFVLAGCVGVAAAFLDLTYWVFLGIIIVSVLIPIIYSLVVYKRMQAAGQL